MKVSKSLIAIVLTVLMGCQQSASLQSYFVSHQETPGFLQVDIPISVLITDQLQLSDKVKDAWNSVRRLNILAYIKKDDLSQMKKEFETVEGILNTDQYEQLMQMKSDEFKTSIYVKGSDDDLKEMILVLGYQQEGFLVARLLGDDMTLQKAGIIANSLNQVNFNEKALSQFEGFL